MSSQMRNRSKGATIDEMATGMAEVQPELRGGQIVDARPIRMPSQLGETVCSLSMHTEEEVVLASILTSPSDVTIEELVGKTIRIRAAMLTFVNLPSLRVQGEIDEKVMAVFVTDDDMVVSTTTQPVCRFLLLMIKSRPPGEWKPPIECVVKSHTPQEKGKHDYYSLRIFGYGMAPKKGGAA